MNLSLFEMISEKSLYKRRKPKADFISQMGQDEEYEDLNREDVLKLNRIQMRYSKQEIEDFIESHMENEVMDVGTLHITEETAFEKLILAYDYSTRKNSKYRVLNEEETVIQNGKISISGVKICAKETAMIEYYEQLSEEEQEDIKTVIQTLYRQTFLLERKFEKRTGRMVPVREYRVCSKHKEFLEAYFAISGITLHENVHMGMMYIQGETLWGEKLSRLATIYISCIKADL